MDNALAHISQQVFGHIILPFAAIWHIGHERSLTNPGVNLRWLVGWWLVGFQIVGIKLFNKKIGKRKLVKCDKFDLIIAIDCCFVSGWAKILWELFKGSRHYDMLMSVRAPVSQPTERSVLDGLPIYRCGYDID